jgi:hypothetical protein
VTVKNSIACPTRCGADANVSTMKADGLQINCPSCKFQGFARSPKAASSLSRFLGLEAAPAADPKSPPGPAHPPEKDQSSPFPFKL